MEIDKKALERIIGPMAAAAAGGDFTVSLYIFSAKQNGLKKLNLDPKLTSAERARKLQKWAENDRFVAVIERGDQAFAHANSTHAKILAGIQDLSINGKNVKVIELSDDDYAELSAVGEAFEQYVLQPQEAEKDSKESDELAPYRFEARQYFAHQSLVSDKMQMNYIIASMQNIPGQVILKCLRQMSDARKEELKQKREDEKRQDIKERAIKKDILKGEVQKGEIQTKELKELVVEENTARINKTRGGPAAAA